MKRIQVVDIIADWEATTRNLRGERQQRDTLKRLLAIAYEEDARTWISFISGELLKSRRRINRLSARQSRLRRRLGSPQRC